MSQTAEAWAIGVLAWVILIAAIVWGIGWSDEPDWTRIRNRLLGASRGVRAWHAARKPIPREWFDDRD